MIREVLGAASAFQHTLFSIGGPEVSKMLRETHHINRKVVQNIMRAFDFARARDMPLNLYVVINLRETAAHAAASLFEMIRHKYRDWLSYRARRLGARIPPMYVFTFEAVSSPHVNWVLRVPPSLLDEFERKLRRWIAKVQLSQPYDLDVQRLDRYRPYKSLAKYISKGCDPAFIEHFHLTDLCDKHGPQGAFWGKRAGVSPSLNKSMRDVFGYNPKRRSLPSHAPARPRIA
jgi:hypothetical protein